MTVFFNDSLAEQIERGEIFYWSGGNNKIEQSATDGYLITTGASPCQILFEVNSVGTIKLAVYENPTTASGSTAKTAYNMRRDSANTLLTTIQPLNSYTGGTDIVEAIAYNGVQPINSGFSRESGLILKANEEYVYEITNWSEGSLSLSYNIFFREL